MKKTVVWLLCVSLLATALSYAVFGATALTEKDVEISGITAQYYTGVAITPDPKIVYNGTVLKEGKDYKLSYSNNVVAGSTASVYITFMGDYEGEIVRSFFIVPQSSSGGTVASGSDSTVAASAITVVQSPGGTVTCENKKAITGASIGFSVTANDGYYVLSVSVNDANGSPITVNDKGYGMYSFKMPSRAVVISAEFTDKKPAATAAPTTTTTPQTTTTANTGVVGVASDGLTPVTLTDIPQQQETFKNPFTDVKESDYFYEPVMWAYKKNVTKGMTDTTFVPSGTCTRGQTVTFLWRAAGSPNPENNANPFTDIKESDYFYKAVLWAVEQGITKGTAEKTFSPSATCTRGQVVTFLYRATSGTVSSVKTAFTDVDVNEYYADPVAWAVEKGVTTGVTATTFAPKNNCTRGQIVTFIYRAMGK
ncbi:MAG: S-layer homology domain-containing protein [Clostridia bacterium]|nr:S-layer homology domain-containing protein [Clostridia bacterium]